MVVYTRAYAGIWSCLLCFEVFFAFAWVWREGDKDTLVVLYLSVFVWHYYYMAWSEVEQVAVVCFCLFLICIYVWVNFLVSCRFDLCLICFNFLCVGGAKFAGVCSL